MKGKRLTLYALGAYAFLHVPLLILAVLFLPTGLAGVAASAHARFLERRKQPS